MTFALMMGGGVGQGGAGGGWVDKAKMRCDWTSGGGGAVGLASVLDFQSLFVFIKGNWVCAMARHHVEPNINISLTRNLPFDSSDSEAIPS